MSPQTENIEPFVRYKNSILPPKQFRFCGDEFQNDQYYLTSASKEAQRLIDNFGLTKDSKVLDVGCGMGRLATGIINVLGDINCYNGIDVSPIAVEWCRLFIGKGHPNFDFVHLNFSNERYNPGGRTIEEKFRFPFEDDSYDIIYLYSVFSHMNKEDVAVYLKEFHRVLKPSGKIFLTGFVEEGVPDMTENPEGYRMKWSGPLHCVRFDKKYFENLLTVNKFSMDKFDYENETDGQSGVYLTSL
ncbi:MAG: class I SAM-dependent methyltransferase [candidate division Zixibacteria bacterium]|nr:class I SAM-dependent methyltransferase [candidate division Zixibacteria bacterium]